MDVFESCRGINDLVEVGKDQDARDELIKLLEYHYKNGIEFSEILNHLIREVGLYPYLNPDTASWQDRFVYESFKADIGGDEVATLHREQSRVLKELLEGNDLAISAPTSFGKSFIIDSFIAINNPRNVIIIVPTVALTDEVRRRLQKKFRTLYKIITTSDVSLADKNIMIFPQERAIHYIDSLENVDMLIVDEFYKASPRFDPDRSPSLLNAILKLGKKANQRYYLAPNISSLRDNPLTKGMDFREINFNTVYLEKHNWFEEIKGDEDKKSIALIRILTEASGKTLVYAGTHPETRNVTNIILDKFDPANKALMNSFEEWLARNYTRNWSLSKLAKRGVGIHNGQLHRPLSQIQIRLFELDDGLDTIISTSSIIEGVNTSAENVVLWRNKIGPRNLTDFTYKNIIGRGGRMFKHFVGNIYILEKPPASTETELELELPDKILGGVDENEYNQELSKEQISKIISYREEMEELLGTDKFRSLLNDKRLESSDYDLIRDIAKEIASDPNEWRGLGYLNSRNVEDWDPMLYKVMKLEPSAWGVRYHKFVGFVKIINDNWEKSIPDLLKELDDFDLGIDDLFSLERTTSFKLARLLNDVNVIQSHVLEGRMDLSSFISRVSHAFLPPLVYHLEEYGLPRMISKKIHGAGVFDFVRHDFGLDSAVEKLCAIGYEGIVSTVPDLSEFDKFFLGYFFEGIGD